MNNTNRCLMASRVIVAFAGMCTFEFLCLPATALAQDWTFSPQVTLTAEYNDNARLNVNEAAQDELRGGELDAQTRIARRTPTGFVVFIPRASTNYYSDDEEDESDDFFLSFNGERRAQKSTWSFRARYSGEQVLRAELEDPDFDNPDVDRPITDDTGLIRIKDRRLRFSVSPGVEFQISPRNRIEVVGDYVDTSYDNNTGGLEDYSYVNLDINLKRQLTEQNTFALQLSGNTYEVDEGDFMSDSFGISANFGRQFSPQNSGFVYAGVQQIESDSTVAGVPVSTSDSTFQGGLGMTREYEISRFVLDLQHSVYPSGTGLLSERTQFRAILSRQLSPLVTGSISARYTQENTVPDSQIHSDRDFGQLRLGISWRINRDWSLVGAYRYSQQEFSTENDSATSNSASLGIRYAPPRRN